jgi:hypothetical protein
MLRQGMCLQQIIRVIWINELNVDLLKFYKSYDPGCSCSWCPNRADRFHAEHVKVDARVCVMKVDDDDDDAASAVDAVGGGKKEDEEGKTEGG